MAASHIITGTGGVKAFALHQAAGLLQLYYNTAGVGYSDQMIHLGTYDASLDQLEALADQDVIVEIAR